MEQPRAPMMADQKWKVQGEEVEVLHDPPDHPVQVQSLQALSEVEECLLARKAGRKLARKKSSFEETHRESRQSRIT